MAKAFNGAIRRGWNRQKVLPDDSARKSKLHKFPLFTSSTKKRVIFRASATFVRQVVAILDQLFHNIKTPTH